MPGFDGKTNRFITYFCDTEDLKQAAVLSSITLSKAKSLYRQPEIRAEIEKRLDVLHYQSALLRAKAHALGVNFLDKQLVKAVKVGAEKGDIKALELGYRRVGIFRDNEFIGAPQTQQPKTDLDAPPPIFRVERTVTRTEQITERAEGHAPGMPALPAPKVLEY